MNIDACNETRHTSTPVALFIFNRPETTREVAMQIHRARPSKLLVVADGPRQNRPEDEIKCRQAREVIEDIDWDCEVLYCFSAENMGCRLRVASGIDWVFTQVEEAIILEDDCFPTQSFFRYCDELIAKYRDEPDVHMISGNNLLFGRKVCRTSYYFSRFYKIWGWATWRRAWQHYDLEMSAWPKVRETKWLEEFLPTAKMAAMARHIFDGTYSGIYTTWEYQWVLASWLQGGRSIVPCVNMIKNIGFGENATHMTDTNSRLAHLKSMEMQFPLVHPNKTAYLNSADKLEWELLYGQRNGGMIRRYTRALAKRIMTHARHFSG